MMSQATILDIKDQIQRSAAAISNDNSLHSAMVEKNAPEAVQKALSSAWNDFVDSPTKVLDVIGYLPYIADDHDQGKPTVAASKTKAKAKGKEKGAKGAKAEDSEAEEKPAAVTKNDKEADLLKSLELKMQTRKKVLQDKMKRPRYDDILLEDVLCAAIDIE